MATTRFVFDPLGASFPATNFPQLLLSNRRPALAFDTTTEETCYWMAIAPQGLSGALTAIVHYAMASATSGGVAWGVSVEAITSGDAVDTDAADSFDTENVGTDAAVPGTAGYLEAVSVSLSSADSVAAGDYVRLRLARKVGNAADTATGDAYVLAVELQEA